MGLIFCTTEYPKSVCKICKKVFQKLTKNQIICPSQDCRKEAERIRSAKSSKKQNEKRKLTKSLPSPVSSKNF